MDDGTPLTPEAHYDRVRPLLKSLRKEVLFALEKRFENSSTKLHSISGRVKTKGSYLDKINNKGYEQPLEQVHDLVGARIVCLYVSDLPKLRQIVDEVFEIVEEEDKVDRNDDSFGYSSMHYVCRLKRDSAGPRYDDLKEILFEVQCRTILMDAWANVSHHLAYKGKASVPAKLRRDFSALAGLFHVADSQFETLAAGSRASDAAAVKTFTTKGGANGPKLALSLPIDKSTMNAYLRDKYPDRKHTRGPSLSDFVQEVTAVGYTSFEQLDADLDAGYREALADERESPPAVGSGGKVSGRYLSVGLARTALAIANKEYDEQVYEGLHHERRARRTKPPRE